MTSVLDEVADLLRLPGTSVLFVTGAGLSADSGLPTYRGVGGIYDGVETDVGLPIEVVLSGPMLEQNPEITWRFLRQIADACRGRTPNRGHDVIAAFERRQERCLTLTQNVDGFHLAAGSTNLIDIHGDLHDLRCTACAYRTTVELADASTDDALPRCPECDALLRPDVVLFDELLPEAKIDRLYAELDRGFDVVIAVGTSAVFPYITAPVVNNLRAGRPAVEINPGETDLTPFVTHRIALGAAEALDALWTTATAED